MEHQETGKVWLAGAGPGDAGLLTRKAEQVLESADVVVYDHLVGRDILARIRPDQKAVNVGKISGYHPIPQEEIGQILVEEARQGKKVVRLKGGDPFLFGRGGEELLKLKEAGIPFEVIPGVTSALAVPAYAGIPVTHRDYVSSLHIVTGHKKKNGELECDYPALVQAGGTLVFLMGVTALPDIVKGLLDAGMDPQMPSAVIQEGTLAGQRKVLAPLAELLEACRKEEIQPPAIIVVGQVCRLSEEISWYEKLPLSGMRVLVTRPRELISSMAERLRKKGAEVLEVPAINTRAVKSDRLTECLKETKSCDWIVFTSQIGVRVFFEYLEEHGLDIRNTYSARFAVIGEGTRKALGKYGIRADLMPETYEGEALARSLEALDVKGKRILIPRSASGNPKLTEILEKAGARTEDIPTYETVYEPCQALDIRREIDAGRIDCVTFTSSSTVHGFAAVSEGADYTRFTAACIGRQTMETAESYGMNCQVAEKATIESLTELVERIHKDR